MNRLFHFKILPWIFIVVGALALGWFGGKLISDALNKKTEAALQQHRVELRDEILAGMNTLNIGDTLEDSEFDDLDGRTYRLSSLVHSSGGAIIGVISPDCMVCDEEVTGLTTLIPDSSVRNRIVFLSGGDVQRLENLRRISGLSNLFLCDRRSVWLSRYKVNTFPFNLVVDDDLTVRRVIPAALLPDDVDRFLKETAAAD